MFISRIFSEIFHFSEKKKKKKLFREYFTLCVKIGIFRLGESPCKMEAGPKGSTNETIPFKRVIDGERLANRYLDYSSYLRSILGRPIILYHMLAFKCALCKNNYATPRLADVRFHVYATRPIKRPFAAQIIADAPMHSLCTLFFLFPLSLRVGGEREREHHLCPAPPSNFRLRFNIGARLIRDDGFSGISSLYYKKASPRWTADVTRAFFVGRPV